ncbi:DUF3325 domain-containing protein [Pelagibius sp. 7325]|uniref:DUF3325 domain-containing protein n=1 Tax=Pelagibius sp. 7325 TaxID=3131994 RepID=UPI0030EDFCF2
MTALSLLLAYGGFAGLALAQERHARQALQRTLSNRLQQWFRMSGALCLSAALIACITAAGTASGIVLWCGVLSAAAVALLLMLCLAPRWFFMPPLLLIPFAFSVT